MAGDNALYKQYAQARQEVGSRTYSSAEDPVEQDKQEQALGYFLSKWITFERAVQKNAEGDDSYTEYFDDFFDRSSTKFLRSA